MGEEGSIEVESVKNLLLSSEIYCSFALAQTLWVLHIEVESMIWLWF